ncbi:Pkinase-domain-containing protein [Epithele typhae]|uniref:Pkinase-domain-containing protein n=1 Tax=Epithele typhae TaxID=378194 RepID=UPI002007FFA3|nr:Pkinase-domain-containing protein [Epithele typhae]KAH9941132.1 Pkinase-domain-containing protein [Epithele typhae]
MLHGLPKRPASGSPDRDRPSKRMATSSPEEGELDDGTPPPPPALRSPSPPPAGGGVKVPFPFKKKPRQPENGAGPSTSANGVADRGRAMDADKERERDGERRYVDDEPKRFGLPPRPPNERDWRGGRAGDRWEPEPARYGQRARWEAQSYVPDQRPYTRSPSRERRYRSPSPRSLDRRPLSRSRSPSSPRSPLTPASGKEKHRLPPPRPVVPESDTYRSAYDRERWKDEDERERYGRQRESYDPVRDRREGTNDYQSYTLRSPSPRPPISPRATPRHSANGNDTSPLPPADLPPKPAAPLVTHSPQPLPSTLPPVESEIHAAKSMPNVRVPIETKAILVKKRKLPAVQRSREEEKEAYGRLFEGCGQKSDVTMLSKIGEGTFGEVHKAKHRRHGTVALKRILMHNEKEGMPVTALREIKILKSLRHPCIVNILDMFVVRSNGKDPLSVYMVFPYMDHDLAGLLENERVKLTPSQIKLYMKQLLEGTEYMHRNHILHRDMKAANLLITNEGRLKIADFGLARAYDPDIVRHAKKKYTNVVVTRWYRPPELLLGARQYGGEVDMWGVGCVLGEMFFRKPILPGSSDLDQLDKIWRLCGTPTAQSWPDYPTLPGCEGVKDFNMTPRRLRQTYESIGPETVDLLDKLLVVNPKERLTASQALNHDYFWTDPLPADPKTLPHYEASHEFDKRGRRQLPPPNTISNNGAFETVPRNLPMPTGVGQQHGRPAPPREVFRNGPPASAGGGHPAMYMPHVPNPGPRYQPVPQPAPIQLAPTQLPPIKYVPGQGIPSHLTGALSLSIPMMPTALPPPPTYQGRGAPPGLPARPQGFPAQPSQRRNGRGQNDGYGGYGGGGGELNYG